MTDTNFTYRLQAYAKMGETFPPVEDGDVVSAVWIEQASRNITNIYESLRLASDVNLQQGAIFTQTATTSIPNSSAKMAHVPQSQVCYWWFRAITSGAISDDPRITLPIAPSETLLKQVVGIWHLQDTATGFNHTGACRDEGDGTASLQVHGTGAMTPTSPAVSNVAQVISASGHYRIPGTPGRMSGLDLVTG